MPTLGITGGIATGKSSFTAALVRNFAAQVFDADQCARQLLAQDAEVLQAVLTHFGPQVFDEAGAIDRARLREIVFQDSARRVCLESILHPLVRSHWLALAAKAAESGQWLFANIPLLFETRGDAHCDRVVVVACSSATQHQRLHEDRGLDASMAERIIASQLDLSLKVRKSDHLIWNDSTPRCLDQQAALFAGWLRSRHV